MKRRIEEVVETCSVAGRMDLVFYFLASGKSSGEIVTELLAMQRLSLRFTPSAGYAYVA